LINFVSSPNIPGDGFVTMLAHSETISVQEPKLSPLSCATKDHYFTRLSLDLDPDKPRFKKRGGSTSEDANVEHLLDVFTAIDADSPMYGMSALLSLLHLYEPQKRAYAGFKNSWAPRIATSRRNACSISSWLFESVGNFQEYKNLLGCALRLWREQGNDGKLPSRCGTI